VTGHVLQLSDVHLSAGRTPLYDRDGDARLATVLAAYRASGFPAELVLLTGDLSDDGSRGGCERLAEAVAALGLPVLAVPGNHDTAEVVRDIWPAGAAEVGAWRVLGVDTSRPQQVHGTVDTAAELARLDAYDRRPTLLALHHPPWSPSENEWFDLDGADDLLAGLGRRPHVKAVVSGHLHEAFDRAEGSLRLLGCPSTIVAIVHDGVRYALAETGTGARLLTLADDGTLETRLLEA
jgi:3',5'-cyclic-AMP phosphodiesterase